MFSYSHLVKFANAGVESFVHMQIVGNLNNLVVMFEVTDDFV